MLQRQASYQLTRRCHFYGIDELSTHSIWYFNLQDCQVIFARHEMALCRESSFFHNKTCMDSMANWIDGFLRQSFFTIYKRTYDHCFSTA